MKALRTGFRIAVFCTLIFIVILGILYHNLTGSLPQTAGELSVSSLEASVDIYRDALGIPHIYARNERDLYRAMGYVIAQDRLWQMDFLRRVSYGRLSEIFGPETIGSDKFLRIWGFGRHAPAIYAQLSEESRTFLQAYSDGVNDFIGEHWDDLPVEFSILRYKPELWHPEHSVAFARLMAFKLSFSWYLEPVLAQLTDNLGPEKAREIFPEFPSEGPYIISQAAEPFWTAKPFLDSGLALHNLLGVRLAHMGSNSWVVSGEKSESGKPMLANDPHLELNAPSIWYEMHLSGGGINVAGVVLPGAPGVVIGHNEDIAWGLTNGMIDDADFYYERINPGDSLQYWRNDNWENFNVLREDIVVKDGDLMTLVIRESDNGVVISDLHPAIQGSGKVMTMKWVGHLPSDEFLCYIQMSRAHNWETFRDAVSHFRVPAQNFVFASTEGDIGYYLAGAIPIRQNTTGVLPHNGWESKGQWLGMVDFASQPHIFNPPERYIVTANNKIVDDKYPYYLSNQWEPQSRAARIHERLLSKDKLSIDDFKSMQLDHTSRHAQRLLPIVISEASAYLDTTPDQQIRDFRDLLKDWDGTESAESIAASIFHAFLVTLTENVLRDEMGSELFDAYISLGNAPTRVIAKLLEGGKSSWFDNIATPQVETKSDVVVKSLKDAQVLLEKLAGPEMGNWMWGSIHQLKMEHPLGKVRVFDPLFNIGPFKREGSAMTIDKSEYSYKEPFKSLVGASTRQIVDLSDIRHTLSVITSGQSGQVLSDHYSDQTPLWVEGEYHTMTLDSLEVVSSAVRHLTLLPEDGDN